MPTQMKEGSSGLGTWHVIMADLLLLKERYVDWTLSIQQFCAHVVQTRSNSEVPHPIMRIFSVHISPFIFVSLLKSAGSNPQTPLTAGSAGSSAKPLGSSSANPMCDVTSVLSSCWTPCQLFLVFVSCVKPSCDDISLPMSEEG
jgi:hypothetical protein